MSAPKNSEGFTLVEIIIVVAILAIVTVTAYRFSTGSFTSFWNLQTDSVRVGNLAQQSQRLAKVIRGATDITDASDSSLSLYAYFAPSDSYVSQLDYYLSSDGSKLMADVTPLDANTPNGNPITAKKSTYTVIDNFYLPSGSKLFSYLNSSGGSMSLPISDLHTIKGVRISLAVKSKTMPGTDTELTVDVSLRNRKTNL